MDFKEIFPMKKPIIGMLHLAGDKPITRAIEEMNIYREEGVNGVIVEDYHGDVDDVLDVLEFLKTEQVGEGLVKGVNLLNNPYDSLEMAYAYGCSFVQFDNIHKDHINLERYFSERKIFPDIVVLGGVRFKYQPGTGKSLEQDVTDARSLCEAIVTTGDGTGIETPLEDLRSFREAMGDYPLIVGAGVNPSNVYDQLKVVDGAIVGSSFKPNGDTRKKVERDLVQQVMEVVERVRRGL